MTSGDRLQKPRSRACWRRANQKQTSAEYPSEQESYSAGHGSKRKAVILGATGFSIWEDNRHTLRRLAVYSAQSRVPGEYGVHNKDHDHPPGAGPAAAMARTTHNSSR